MNISIVWNILSFKLYIYMSAFSWYFLYWAKYIEFYRNQGFNRSSITYKRFVPPSSALICIYDFIVFVALKILNPQKTFVLLSVVYMANRSRKNYSFRKSTNFTFPSRSTAFQSQQFIKTLRPAGEGGILFFLFIRLQLGRKGNARRFEIAVFYPRIMSALIDVPHLIRCKSVSFIWSKALVNWRKKKSKIKIKRKIPNVNHEI